MSGVAYEQTEVRLGDGRLVADTESQPKFGDKSTGQDCPNGGNHTIVRLPKRDVFRYLDS